MRDFAHPTARCSSRFRSRTSSLLQRHRAGGHPDARGMCIALIAFGVHPQFRVVVAANRDEFHARPAAPAAWWDTGILAGRDLKEGGTWLGIDRRGRFALLTNVREPSRHDASAPSRGTLVPRLLGAEAAPSVALPELVAAGSRHNGFNLVAGGGNRQTSE